MALLHTTQGAACPVCQGGSCIGFPDTPHNINYPFIGGGVDPMAQEPYIIAPHRIDDPELERAVYGVGDRVPIADAIKYGLIDPPADDKPKKPSKRATQGPKQDRARKPSENRGK